MYSQFHFPELHISKFIIYMHNCDQASKNRAYLHIKFVQFCEI